MADKPEKEFISDEERERNAMFNGENNIAGVVTVTITHDTFSEASPEASGLAYDIMVRERTISSGGEVVKDRAIPPKELGEVLRALGGAAVALISSQEDAGTRLQLASGFGGDILKQVITPADFMRATREIREKRESCEELGCDDCSYTDECITSKDKLTDEQKASLDMVLKSPGFKVPEC